MAAPPLSKQKMAVSKLLVAGTLKQGFLSPAQVAVTPAGQP